MVLKLFPLIELNALHLVIFHFESNIKVFNEYCNANFGYTYYA